MPLLWRGMRMKDDQPEVGRGKNLLGVVVGSDPGDDIAETDGQVQPGTGGMSVAPTADLLPSHRVPKRLKVKYPDRFPDAVGSNQLHCWSLGDGAFVAGAVGASLVLRLDPARPDEHGFVEPDAEMSLTDYEAALAATRPRWARWEE
jgi:hypothetical protein